MVELFQLGNGHPFASMIAFVFEFHKVNVVSIVIWGLGLFTVLNLHSIDCFSRDNHLNFRVNA